MATVYAEIGKTEYSGKHLTEITGTAVSLVRDWSDDSMETDQQTVKYNDSENSNKRHVSQLFAIYHC